MRMVLLMGVDISPLLLHLASTLINICHTVGLSSNWQLLALFKMI